MEAMEANKVGVVVVGINIHCGDSKNGGRD